MTEDRSKQWPDLTEKLYWYRDRGDQSPFWRQWDRLHNRLKDDPPPRRTEEAQT